ncbi:serine-rich adhesin for platelets-like [Littorina saxatilis]|uniref:serine-rich adhesin for platelets-like n=1 Tax=Littorina saxatilis TaxID=31220 RepID=UPI0038B685F0
MMATGTRLLFALILGTQLSFLEGAVRITECPNGAVLLREDRYPAILTCEGFNDTDTVTWSVKAKGSSDTVSITCRPETRFCNSPDLDLMVNRSSTSGKSMLVIVKEYRLRVGDESVRCSTSGNDTVSCDIRVINRAVLSDCQVTPSSSNWTVSGSCDYVGAYVPSPDDYTCTWYRHTVGQNQTIPGNMTKHMVVESNTEYYNGTCSFSTSLPRQEGNYVYSVDFYPGPGISTVENETIERPDDPVTSCSGYINSTKNIRCDCLPNPTTPGSPLPTLQWRGLSPGLQLTIFDPDSDQVYVCQLTWGPLDDRVNKETPLAFGPDNVRIVHQGSQIADEQLALTCELSNVYPSAVITWSTPIDAQCQSAAVQSDNRTCNLVPRRSHDGKNVTCTARNSLFPDELFGSSTYTLRLTYPPPIPPVIVGYKRGTALSVGSQLILTCFIGGGKPLVSSITFDCGTDVPGTSGSLSTQDNNVSKTFTIPSLEATDNGAVCVCGGQWGGGNSYNRTTGIVLTIDGGSGAASLSTQASTGTTKVIIYSTQRIAGNTKAAPDRAVGWELIVAVAVSVVAFILLLFIIAVIVATRKSRRRSDSNQDNNDKTDSNLAAHSNPVYADTDERNSHPKSRSRASAAAPRLPAISEESLNSRDNTGEANVEHSTMILGEDQSLSASRGNVSPSSVPIIRVTPPQSTASSMEEDEGISTSRPVSSSASWSSDNSAATDSTVSENSVTIHADADGNSRIYDSETRSLDETAAADTSVEEDHFSNHVHFEHEVKAKKGNGYSVRFSDQSAFQDDDDSMTNLYTDADGSSKQSSLSESGSDGILASYIATNEGDMSTRF